jgi:transcriptional regulator with XRE-family HTH domain
MEREFFSNSQHNNAEAGMGNPRKSRNAAEEPPEAAQPSPEAAENPAGPAEPAAHGAEIGARKDFADELRSWRGQRGLTQVGLGSKIRYSGSYVSDIERCYRVPTLEFAQICDRELELPGTFVRAFKRISLDSFAGWFAPVLSFETQASKIQNWDMRYVPGLLQTPDYARAQFRAGRPHEPEDIIERDVAARMQRQDIFSREHPPFAWFIIDESALRRVFGNRMVMAAQLDKLLEDSSRPNIVIQIIPMETVDCSGADGPMTVFDIPGSTQVGYTEGRSVGRILDAPDEVARLTMIFDHLRAAALPWQESTRLLTEIRSEYSE